MTGLPEFAESNHPEIPDLQRGEGVSTVLLRVVPFAECRPEVVSFLIAAGTDPAAYEATYMPREPSPIEASGWVDDNTDFGWLLYLDDSPVGLVVASTPISQGVPAGHLETDTYVVPEHRGKGLATKGWDLVEALLPSDVVGLCGVVWETNASALARLRRSGYTKVGRVWYSGSADPADCGWCEVWTKPVTR